ncbi:MAG: GerMN domain-containing protein [Actinomycetota bacterium]|nr:GerMN domain-containing protein [Actinomycetota bacterium]
MPGGRMSMLLIAALVLVGVACERRSPPAGQSPPAASTVTAPDATVAPSGDRARTDRAAPGAQEATAYFARSAGDRIWTEPETHALPEPTLGVARAAMRELVAGDTIDPNLRSLAPAGTAVLGVAIDGDVLVVDLSEAVRSGSGSARERAFAQQLAHTAAQFDGVDAVRLRVEGRPLAELWGHLDWSRPITPDPFALSPIDIEHPRWGQRLPVGELTVTGQATTFEATVDLLLIAPDGAVAEDSFTTASVGAPERGAWSHTFTVTAPGRWTVEAAAPDPSSGEGPPPFRTRVQVEVAGV